MVEVRALASLEAGEELTFKQLICPPTRPERPILKLLQANRPQTALPMTNGKQIGPNQQI